MSEFTLVDVDPAEVLPLRDAYQTIYLPIIDDFLEGGRPLQEVIFSGPRAKTVYNSLTASARRNSRPVRLSIRGERVFILRKDS